MKSTATKKLDRRDFVKRGITIAGTAFCFRNGLRAAVANSIETGNPLLTAANLNLKFAQARTSGTLRSIATSIKPSPVGWLRSNYSISDSQSNGLRTISESQWTEIKRVLTFVESNRGASLMVVIHESTASQSKKCSATVRVISEAQVGAETLKAEAEARTT